MVNKYDKELKEAWAAARHASRSTAWDTSTADRAAGATTWAAARYDACRSATSAAEVARYARDAGDNELETQIKMALEVLNE